MDNSDFPDYLIIRAYSLEDLERAVGWKLPDFIPVGGIVCYDDERRGGYAKMFAQAVLRKSCTE